MKTVFVVYTQILDGDIVLQTRRIDMWEDVNDKSVWTALFDQVGNYSLEIISYE